MRVRASLVVAVLAVFLTPEVLGQGKIWSVDDGHTHGTPDFTAIQPAVNASSDGDLILVGSGNYDGFSVDNKALTIVVRQNEFANFNGTNKNIEVKNVAAEKSVTLRGFRNPFTNLRPALRLLTSAGTLLGEESDFSGILITNSSSVSLARITNRNGMSASGSEVYAYESEFVPPLSSSGAGIYATNSFIYLSGCWAIGTNGTSASVQVTSTCYCVFPPGLLCNSPFGCSPQTYVTSYSCTPGAAPKPGLNLFNNSKAIVLDSFIQGGSGGTFCNGCSSSACDTDPYPASLPVLTSSGSTVEYLPGKNRHFDMARTAKEGTDLKLTFRGQPGDFVFLLVSPKVSVFYYDGWNGPILPKPEWLVMPLDYVPASGELTHVVYLGPGVAPPNSFSNFIGQALFTHPSLQGPSFIGSWSAISLME